MNSICGFVSTIQREWDAMVCRNEVRVRVASGNSYGGYYYYSVYLTRVCPSLNLLRQRPQKQRPRADQTDPVVFFIFPVNPGKPDSSKKEVVMSGIHCRVFFSLLFVVLTACPALGAPPIKIGALFSITGPASFLGEPERNTAQMVVDEINKAGGIGGRTLELVMYDTQGDATKAVQAATRLIKEDKVVAIIGPSTTGDTMAVIPLVEKAQIPLVSCAAGIKITEPVKKWVFKTAQNDSLAVARIYEQLKKQKISKIAVLTVSDSFGSSGREQLTAQAKSYGIQIITDETYGPKDTDMTAQLTKIRGTQAQAIVCWGTNPGPAIIARNVKQLGLNIPLYMSHGVSSKKFIELAGDAAEGIILPSGTGAGGKSPAQLGSAEEKPAEIREGLPDALQGRRGPLRRSRLGCRHAFEGRDRTGGRLSGGNPRPARANSKFHAGSGAFTTTLRRTMRDSRRMPSSWWR